MTLNFQTLAKTFSFFMFLQLSFYFLSKPPTFHKIISERYFPDGFQRNLQKPGGISGKLSPCDEKITANNTIWMLETKFNVTKPRPLCGVESVAIQMPEWCVRLLVISYQESDPQNNVARKLSQYYQNIEISELQPEKILHGTPLANFTSAEIQSSENYVTHLSDALRAALMYKYGGIFLDLDIIAVRPFGKPLNYITRLVSAGTISGIALKASKTKESIFWDILNSGKRLYSRDIYGSLMHGLGTGVVSYCKSLGVSIKITDKRDELVEKCGEFYILGSNSGGSYSPFWMYEVVPVEKQKQFERIKAENCSFLHWYQTYSRHFTLNLTEDYEFFFAEVAEKFCPKLYRSVNFF